jgi:hypothetical protein
MQNPRSDPPNQASVYELTACCSQSFEELLQLLSKAKADVFDAAETQVGLGPAMSAPWRIKMPLSTTVYETVMI